MEYDRNDSFPFDFEPNVIPFISKSKGKLTGPIFFLAWIGDAIHTAKAKFLDFFIRHFETFSITN